MRLPIDGDRQSRIALSPRFVYEVLSIEGQVVIRGLGGGALMGTGSRRRWATTSHVTSGAHFLNTEYVLVPPHPSVPATGTPESS